MLNFLVGSMLHLALIVALLAPMFQSHVAAHAAAGPAVATDVGPYHTLLNSSYLPPMVSAKCGNFRTFLALKNV